MLKVKVRWSGFIGSPGWSNFFFDTGNEDFYTAEQATAVQERVHTFFNTMKVKFPSNVQFTVQSDVESIAPTSGELLNVLTAPARAPIAGTHAAGSYSGATGMVLTWRTAGVRNGRRVRGRTFLVPIANSIYENDGTISAAQITDTQTLAQSLFTAPAGGLPMGVWARPTAVGAEDGAFHPITNVSVPDLAAVLRSRRG